MLPIEYRRYLHIILTRTCSVRNGDIRTSNRHDGVVQMLTMCGLIPLECNILEGGIIIDIELEEWVVGTLLEGGNRQIGVDRLQMENHDAIAAMGVGKRSGIVASYRIGFAMPIIRSAGSNADRLLGDRILRQYRENELDYTIAAMDRSQYGRISP